MQSTSFLSTAKQGDNALGSVCLSVCVFVCVFADAVDRLLIIFVIGVSFFFNLLVISFFLCYPVQIQHSEISHNFGPHP